MGSLDKTRTDSNRMDRRGRSQGVHSVAYQIRTEIIIRLQTQNRRIFREDSDLELVPAGVCRTGLAASQNGAWAIAFGL